MHSSWFPHSGRHWQRCPGVTSLSAEAHNSQSTISRSRYQHWLWHDSFLVREMMDISTADSCILSLYHNANTRTHPLWWYDPKTHLPLFHATAGVRSRYPCELPFFVTNFSTPMLQKLTSQNLHDDMIHTFHAGAKVFTDMLKHYTMMTFHHSVHLAHVSVSIMWSGWLRHPRPCFYSLWTSCTSQTLLYSGNIHHHTHASYENKCPFVLHLSHTENGWYSAVHAWTNPWFPSTE